MLLKEFSTIFDRPEKVKKLREYILSLAVRGKLVEQDENDEPASVLLERIRAEKDRLVKEKKIKKEKPLLEISEDEIPYELPKGWEWVRLGDMVSILGDGLHGTPNYSDKGEYYFVNGNNLNNGKIEIKSNTKMVDLSEFEKYKKPLNNSTMFISINGTLGNLAFYNDEKIILGKSACYFNLLNDTNKMYIFWALKSGYVVEYLNNVATGTTIKNVSLKSMKLLNIPLPPLNEQKRIVEKVNYLMEFCDKLEAQLEKKVKYATLSAKSVLNGVSNCSSYDELEEALRFIIENFKDLTLADGAVGELKNAILSLAVKGKLVPQDDSDEPVGVLLERISEEKDRLVKEKKIKKEKPLPEIGDDEIPYELPKGWEWVRLKDVGHNHGQKKPDSKFSYIDVGSINKELGVIGNDVNLIEAEDAPSRARKIVKKGTVLYSTVRPYLLNIAILDKEFEYEPIASTAFAIIHPYLDISNRYIYYYLRSNVFVSYVESHMVGMAYPAINDEKLFKGLIPLPPVKEQKRIVEKVDKLMKVCDELELRIEESKKYNEKLMESILKESFKA